MEPEFNLTPTEIIFLVVAVLVTIPIVIFAWWILREHKRDSQIQSSETPPQETLPKP